MKVPEYKSNLEVPESEYFFGLKDKMEDIESELDCLAVQIDNVEIRMRRMYKNLDKGKYKDLKDVCIDYLSGLGAYEYLCNEVDNTCKAGQECLDEEENLEV